MNILGSWLEKFENHWFRTGQRLAKKTFGENRRTGLS